MKRIKVLSAVVALAAAVGIAFAAGFDPEPALTVIDFRVWRPK